MQREDSKVRAAMRPTHWQSHSPKHWTLPPEGDKSVPCKGKETVETANTHLDPKLVTKEDDRAGSLWGQK